MVTGGRYMTSGKVYEFMATGLPVVSAHEVEHDASTRARRHPLWAAAGPVEARRSPTPSPAARLAVETSDADRAAARPTSTSSRASI